MNSFVVLVRGSFLDLKWYFDHNWGGFALASGEPGLNFLEEWALTYAFGNEMGERGFNFLADSIKVSDISSAFNSYSS